MPAPVYRKRLLVKFQIWGRPGTNIWYEDNSGRRQFVKDLHTAREAAHKLGYEGITVRAV